MKTVQIIFAIILALVLPADGIAGYAIFFNQNNRADAERVRIPKSETVDIAGRALTIECWINMPQPNLDTELTILNKEIHYEIRVRVNQFNVAIYTGAWAWEGQGRVNANEWTHVAATYDGNAVRNYVNGQLTSTVNRQGNIVVSDTAIYLATRPLGDFVHNYVGAIDEFRLWNVVRTQQQIAENMNVLLRGDEEGLMGYWPMDEGEGQTIFDRSGNENHGTFGTTPDEDRYDPQWIDSEAPIYGGEIWLSAEEVEFGPIPADDQPQVVLQMANVSEENDEFHSFHFALTDQGDDPDWLNFEPEEGDVEVGDTLEVTFTADIGDLELGEYERTVLLECNAVNLRSLEFPVHIFVVEGFGRMSGEVSAEGMEEMIQGAVIHLEGTALTGTTDQDGNYAFDHVPAWTYNVTAYHPDFIAFTERDVVMEPEGEVELNFSLLHSVFVIQPIAVNTRLMPDERREIPLTISNPGNAPLEWTATIAFPQGVDAEPWEMRQAWSVGDTVGDDRVSGVAFAEGRFFVAGSAGNDPNAIYILNRDGNLIGSFVQPGDSRYGMDDLAWDGELLWGSGANYIYAFTTDGDSVTSFRGPNRTTHALAWDPQREVLWTSDITSRIISISRDGEEGADIGNPGMNISGLAFWQADPDGYQLYVSGTAEGVPTVRKLNVETGEWLDVAVMELQEGWSPQGVEITREFDPYSWVFLMLRSIPPEQGGDRIEMWQLLANTTWINYEPLEGVVEPDGELATTLTLDASGVPEDVEFEAQLQFAHNGFGQADTVQVNLTVSLEPANEPPSAFGLLEPPNDARFPNSDTTLTFSWEESVDPNPADTVSYRLWLGLWGVAIQRDQDTLLDSTSFFAPNASLPVDIRDALDEWFWMGDILLIEWWVDAISGVDTVESNFRFGLELGQLDVGDDPAIPIHFGLHALYPNPFNSQLRVEFGLPVGSFTTLELFDIAGRRAAMWIEGEIPLGLHRRTFAADALPAGVYMLKLSAGGKVQARKVVLLK